jgi:hypothetical protein
MTARLDRLERQHTGLTRAAVGCGCTTHCATLCGSCAAAGFFVAWALGVRAKVLDGSPEIVAQAEAAARGVIRPPDAVLLEYVERQLAPMGPRNELPKPVTAMLQLFRVEVHVPGFVENAVATFRRGLYRLRDVLAAASAEDAESSRQRENGSEGA